MVKILEICLFVLTECTNVTDRQTDTHDSMGCAAETGDIN